MNPARTCRGKRRFAVEHGTPSLGGRSSIQSVHSVHELHERHYFQCATAGLRRVRSPRK